MFLLAPFAYCSPLPLLIHTQQQQTRTITRSILSTTTTAATCTRDSLPAHPKPVAKSISPLRQKRSPFFPNSSAQSNADPSHESLLLLHGEMLQHYIRPSAAVVPPWVYFSPLPKAGGKNPSFSYGTALGTQGPLFCPQPCY